MENTDIVWIGDANQVAVVVAASHMHPLPDEVKDEITAYCQKIHEGATVIFLDSVGARENAERLLASATHVES